MMKKEDLGVAVSRMVAAVRKEGTHQRFLCPQKAHGAPVRMSKTPRTANAGSTRVSRMMGLGVGDSVVVPFWDIVGVAEVLAGKMVDVRVNEEVMIEARPRVVVVMSEMPVERERTGEGEAGAGRVVAETETEGDWADAGEKRELTKRTRKSRTARWADMATWMGKESVECRRRRGSLSVSGQK
jgi:hypothetical protein